MKFSNKQELKYIAHRDLEERGKVMERWGMVWHTWEKIESNEKEKEGERKAWGEETCMAHERVGERKKN